MVHWGRPAHVCVRRSIHNCVWSSPPWLQAVCTYLSWRSPRGTWVRRVRVCVWQCVCTPHSLSCLGTYPSPGYSGPRQESPLRSAGRRCPWCWRLWRPAPTKHLPATFKAPRTRRSQDNKASILPLGTPGLCGSAHTWEPTPWLWIPPRFLSLVPTEPNSGPAHLTLLIFCPRTSNNLNLTLWPPAA